MYSKIPTRLLLAIVILFVFLDPHNLFAANIQEGAKLFKANCAVCHSLGTNKIIGPGLDGVAVRVPRPYQDWMGKWIKNNVQLRKSGDAYANQVYADNNGALMTVFEGTLNDTQIQNIIAFLATSPKTDTTIVREIAAAGNPNEVRKKYWDYSWIYFILVILVSIVVAILRRIRKSLQIAINRKNGIPVPINTSIGQEIISWIVNHKSKFVLLCIFLLTLSSVYAWDYMWDIHVTPGYHPSQPINFIHKVHADDNGIACLYCHSGAEKGKVAGIPTLNVCMNCHKGIQGSNPEYKREIAKIYYATGWDEIKSDYTKPQHPIKWTRVHSLPDFAYFNHAQHVVVGKISCQKCHGDCSTFTTNQQYASLTMGWCVNCHRETQVQMNDNGYYSKLHLAISKKFGSDRKITVADMGGLECGKCHY